MSEPQGVRDTDNAVDRAAEAHHQRDEAFLVQDARQVHAPGVDADGDRTGIDPQRPDQDLVDDLASNVPVRAQEHPQQIAAADNALQEPVGIHHGKAFDGAALHEAGPVHHRPVASALAAESETATMLVLGSRGRGGFRSLLLGSTSLAAATFARCPVVIVRGDSVGGEPARRDVVLGLDLRDADAGVLQFAFEAAAARPRARLRVVHGWTMGASAAAGGPVFDSDAVHQAVTRELAEVTAGWSEKYPQVELLRSTVRATPAAALVETSADAALTVVGRRIAGTSMGLRLGSVAHAVLLHAESPVAVVPY